MPIAGSCHYGKTAFEIDGAIPAKLSRCNCSFCAKRGTLYAYYEPAQFRLTTPAADVATYRWDTKTVAHNFCANCGGRHDRRQKPLVGRKDSGGQSATSNAIPSYPASTPSGRFLTNQQ